MLSSTIKIAMAEDHPLVRNGIATLINNFNRCSVVADADNGYELISKISGLEAKPDISILDICMPVMDGYSTILELKKLYPSMKFLVLTMLHDEYSIIRMIKNGANGYMLKRCNPNDLRDAIYDIYANGYYYSNIASEKAFEIVAHNHLPKLSEKELQFIRLCCTDLSYAKIAEQMYVSVRTIEDYKSTLHEKIKINTRTGLALFAVRAGIVSLND